MQREIVVPVAHRPCGFVDALLQAPPRRECGLAPPHRMRQRVQPVVEAGGHDVVQVVEAPDAIGVRDVAEAVRNRASVGVDHAGDAVTVRRRFLEHAELVEADRVDRAVEKLREPGALSCGQVLVARRDEVVVVERRVEVQAGIVPQRHDLARGGHGVGGPEVVVAGMGQEVVGGDDPEIGLDPRDPGSLHDRHVDVVAPQRARAIEVVGEPQELVARLGRAAEVCVGGKGELREGLAGRMRLRGHTRARGARSSSAAVPSKPRLKSASSTERPGTNSFDPICGYGWGVKFWNWSSSPCSAKRASSWYPSAPSPERYLENFQSLSFSRALEVAWSVVARLDKMISDAKPWDLAKDENQKQTLGAVLYRAAEALRWLSVLLYPVMPEASKGIWNQLGLQGSPGTVDPER